MSGGRGDDATRDDEGRHAAGAVRRDWTFLTNHGHAIVCLARDPDLRVRELAALIGITERAALRILADLEAAGYVRRERHGRRTHHALALDRPLRHRLEREHAVAELVRMLQHPKP